jgi:uncharacterized protein (TIGR02246 family)
VNDRTHRILVIALILGSALASCGREERRQRRDAGATSAADSLRTLVQSVFAAVEARDAGGVLRPMSPEVVYVGDGMVVTGRDSLDALLNRAFAEWDAVEADVEIRDISFPAPDLAVMLWEARVTARVGETHVPFGGVTTAVLQRVSGTWQIIRQHQCAPMPPEVSEQQSTTSVTPLQ